MESMYFIFDGVKSSDMDLYIMQIDHSGFIETPYIGSTDIKEEKIHNKTTPYFYGVDRENLEFTVQFVLMDKYGNPKKWTPQDRNKIARWLIHDEYKEFISSDDLGKRYMVIATSDSNLNLINTQGYVEVTFRCNSPYAWSPVYINSFDLSNNTTSTIIELENMGNVIKRYRPKLEIQMMGDTSVTLTNLSDGGREFKLFDLRTDEIISIDNENEIILSNYPVNINPLANFNRNWLELVFGVNQIKVIGRCKIWVKSCFPIAQ